MERHYISSLRGFDGEGYPEAEMTLMDKGVFREDVELGESRRKIPWKLPVVPGL